MLNDEIKKKINYTKGSKIKKIAMKKMMIKIKIKKLRPCLFLRFKSIFFKKIENVLFFSLLRVNIFLVFSDHFDALMSKIIFKK
jgi:hypothetical protein